MKLKIFILSIFTICSFLVYSQDNRVGFFPFVEYGVKNGLPQEDVISIFQDKKGYVWFGTYTGLAKYNGRKMVLINTETGLKSNSIFSINQDKNNEIYLSTARGVSIIKENTDSIENILSDMQFKKIFIDNQNNKWFYGDENIFCREDNEIITDINEKYPELPKNINNITQSNDDLFLTCNTGIYKLSNNTLTKVYGKSCDFLFVDTENNFWLNSGSKTFKTKSLTELSNNKNEPEIMFLEKILANEPRIIDIKEDKKGKIWFVSDSKVICYDTKNKTTKIYDNEKGINNAVIYCFMVDNEDNIWFGMAGGVQKLTSESLSIAYPNEIDSYTTAIREDALNRKWFICNNTVYYIKKELVNVSETLPVNSIAILPNKNILLVGLNAVYELDVNSLKVINTVNFEQEIPYIETVFVSSKKQIFILTGETGFVYYMQNFDTEPIAIQNSSTADLYQIVEFKNEIIGANNTGLVVFKENTFESLYKLEGVAWGLHIINDVLWVGTDKGLGQYKFGKFDYYASNIFNDDINSISESVDKKHLWIGKNNGLFYFDIKNKKIDFSINLKYGLPGNEIAIDGLTIDKNGYLWIGTFHGLVNYDINERDTSTLKPLLYSKIVLNGNKCEALPAKLKYDQNNLTFELTAISFKDEKLIEYDYKLDGLKNDFSNLEKTHIAQYSNLKPGSYKFQYRAKGKNNLWNDYQYYEFKVLKPFWLKWWFFLFLFAVLFIIVWFIVKWRLNILKQQNIRLEKIIKERTKEIREAYEELNQTNEELKSSIELIQKQKEEIEETHQHITDSINYASRIQNAMLPTQQFFKRYLNDYFILFKPRDVVSGDFYWARKVTTHQANVAPIQRGDSRNPNISQMHGGGDFPHMVDESSFLIYAAADSTGHGVPGAFVSMLGMSLLNEIVSKQINFVANEILNELRILIKKSLKQTGKDESSKDGMDIAICVIDINTKKLQYAGANNPLYIVRDNELIQYKADRQPIGVYIKERDFTNHEIQLQKNDMLYTFSDGFIDQFGGDRGRKYMSKRFKKFLISINHASMQEQETLLDNEFNSWKGELEQIDDVVVIGTKI